MENNDTNKNGVIGVPEGIGGLPPATPATAGDPAKKIEHLTHLMYAIVVVLFIGFAGMFAQCVHSTCYAHQDRLLYW